MQRIEDSKHLVTVSRLELTGSCSYEPKNCKPTSGLQFYIPLQGQDDAGGVTAECYCNKKNAQGIARFLLRDVAVPDT